MRWLVAGLIVVGARGIVPHADAAPIFVAPVFVGLGDLPGGYYASAARSVSADGATVVGNAVTDTPFAVRPIEAFRWTIDEGMVGLGDLPGGANSSDGWGSPQTAGSSSAKVIAGLRILQPPSFTESRASAGQAPGEWWA